MSGWVGSVICAGFPKLNSKFQPSFPYFLPTPPNSLLKSLNPLSNPPSFPYSTNTLGHPRYHHYYRPLSFSHNFFPLLPLLYFLPISPLLFLPPFTHFYCCTHPIYFPRFLAPTPTLSPLYAFLLLFRFSSLLCLLPSCFYSYFPLSYTLPPFF